MVLPTGPLALSQIQSEMGGTNPISMSEYYANAGTGYCSGISGIPSTGSSVSVSHFAGKSKTQVTTSASGAQLSYSGGSNIFTFASSGTFTVSGGTATVDSLVVGGGGGGGGYWCGAAAAPGASFITPLSRWQLKHTRSPSARAAAAARHRRAAGPAHRLRSTGRWGTVEAPALGGLSPLGVAGAEVAARHRLHQVAGRAAKDTAVVLGQI